MIGKTIGHYRIVEEIGRGGMGVVYRAEDMKLKRTVALKFLQPHILSSDKDRSRFTHEAQAAAALHHPNICTVYEINEADDQTFISMAYLEGRSLHERIEQGMLEPVEALRIALQVARGLDAAHQKGIIHRDVKSSNIMISYDGRATIMDFGLAKSRHQQHHTQQGTKMGTIVYMSPEQTRGEPVDHRTDIWSLGVLLYEMVTGQRPFRGDYDEAVIYSILNEEPVPATALMPSIPADIWLAIQRAIAKDPAERYQTMAEMAEDIEAIHDDLRNGSSTRKRAMRTGSSSLKSAPSGGSGFFTARAVRAMGMYIIAVAVIVVAAGYIGGRFALPPHVGHITLVALLALLPTIWILAARGTGQSRAWKNIARVGIPVNVIAVLAIVTGLFGNRDLGAVTQTVTVLDESGQPIERAIPKSEYRKSAIIYFFDNETGNEDDIWVGGGLPVLMQVDLWQDQFVYQRSAIEEPFRQRLMEAGFTDWFDAPWTLKRDIAIDAHIDHLVTGDYTREGDDWIVTVRVHESHTGRLISERVHRGHDLFALADDATVGLRKDLGLSENHIERTPDLPIAEMFTGSEEALHDFCVGIYSALFVQNWPGSVEYLERSVAADSTFAWGHFTLFQLYDAVSYTEKMDETMGHAMQHMYKLPERLQYILKVYYYGHIQEPEKQLGVALMTVELYPEDTQARGLLAAIRLARQERALAIEQYERILEIDPSRTEVLTEIAEQYRAMGDFVRAEEYYQRYLQKYPEDAEVHHALGTSYEIQGKFDEATAQYEKVRVLDPNFVEVLVDIADVASKLDDDERALEIWNEALELAKTPQLRARIHRSMRNYYSNRGEMKKSITHLYSNWSEQERHLPPVAIHIERMGDLCYFVWADETQRALDVIESAKASLSEPWDKLIALGEICIYAELEDADGLEESLSELVSFIDMYKAERLRGEACWAEGEMEEARGNYEAAIDAYRRKLVEDPTDVVMNRSIGRCYRKMGRYEDAAASLESVLVVYPGNPHTHLELALVYHELGDHAKATRHLDRALSRWENADPSFKPAQEARALAAQWQS